MFIFYDVFNRSYFRLKFVHLSYESCGVNPVSVLCRLVTLTFDLLISYLLRHLLRIIIFDFLKTFVPDLERQADGRREVATGKWGSCRKGRI